MKLCHANLRINQRGAALIVTLVFLVLLTILGMATMGTTVMEEKMAHNARDRNLAFQAAETAVLSAESWVMSLSGKPVFPNPSQGLFLPSTTAKPIWDDTTTVNWFGSTNLVMYPCVPLQVGACTGKLAKITTQPKYIIEDLGSIPLDLGSKVIPNSYPNSAVGGNVYRITARGTGGTDAAQVMIQSTFLTQ